MKDTLTPFELLQASLLKVAGNEATNSHAIDSLGELIKHLKVSPSEAADAATGSLLTGGLVGGGVGLLGSAFGGGDLTDEQKRKRRLQMMAMGALGGAGIGGAWGAGRASGWNQGVETLVPAMDN